MLRVPEQCVLRTHENAGVALTCCAVFCSPRPSCLTCETSFPSDTLARFRKQRAAMGAVDEDADGSVAQQDVNDGA